MANSTVHKLIDLIEDVKKVDEMIMLHQGNHDSDFMLSQYRAKKVKLSSDLIGELNSPTFKSATSFLLMKRFLDKFYADSSEVPNTGDLQFQELKKLEAVL